MQNEPSYKYCVRILPPSLIIVDLLMIHVLIFKVSEVSEDLKE